MKNLTRILFPYLLNGKNRDSWVIGQLSRIPRGASILDVGAGEMRYKKFCTHLKYKSQDFNQYTGRGDSIGLQTGRWDTTKIDIISDITKIPVKNFSFNNILCTEVLEHVPHPEQGIKELSRVLKKGGRLILTAPFASQTHFSPYFFSTGFSRNWYKQILSEHGLAIKKIEANGNYFDYINQELLRLPLVVYKYSRFKILAYCLYLLIIPMVLGFWIVSLFSKGSEYQLCFGYHILAIKK